MPERRKILVVEDSEELRTLVTAALCAGGFDVVSARDGRTAESLLDAATPFDLLVLDLVLRRSVATRFSREWAAIRAGRKRR